MELIYKPFGIDPRHPRRLVGKKLFDFAWTKIDDEEPPEAHDRGARWAKVFGRRRGPGRDLPRHARRRSTATARSAGATSPASWPGEKRPDPDGD